ncbi:MAG: excinuclease ABC subunit UvrA [Chlamydiia bacterium]
MPHEEIILKNVCVHNLKGVDLTLKTNQLIVFAGVSGSGKSSLAFDTIYLEGQRRYLESLTTFAKRHIGGLKKPQADLIQGLTPCIAIEQKTIGRNPRSTVGTMTGIYDFLRVLYARVGLPRCPDSLEVLSKLSKEKIHQIILQDHLGEAIYILAPVIENKRTESKELIQGFYKKGYTQARLNGKWIELDSETEIDQHQNTQLQIVVDRIKVEIKGEKRLMEAIDNALRIGQKKMSIVDRDSGKESFFSTESYSFLSKKGYPTLEPFHFSFNHPEGMCPDCQGLGTEKTFHLEGLIDFDKSIPEGALDAITPFATQIWGNIYTNLAKIGRFNLNTPLKDLPDKAKKILFDGVEEKYLTMTFIHPKTKERSTQYISWKGIKDELKKRYNEAKSDQYKEKLKEFVIDIPCSACQGARIDRFPRVTLFQGKMIHELTFYSLLELQEFFLNCTLDPLDVPIAQELIREIQRRLFFLIDVGVGYLSLERTSSTLSGGEAQRVRLASQLGQGLVGTTYILDEPSIGLHPADNLKLLKTLRNLTQQGNTVIVVEHDEETIRHADTIVDVGPYGGEAGGRIVGFGKVQDLMEAKESITGKYLSRSSQIPIPKKRRKPTGFLQIKGASHHNLKNIDVAFPLGVFCAVTGVSGSGKSSLVNDILYPVASNHLMQSRLSHGAYAGIEGLEQLDKVIMIDQQPIGKTPRSNPATYIKVFDAIRDLFASLPESLALGFKAGRFSFNVKEGSCLTCKGMGLIRIDMDFLEDSWVECPHCAGERFDPRTLSVKFKGKNIYEVLELSVDEALTLFAAIPMIAKKLETLQQVGLGYMKIGQSSTTLSGGEAQRIKLAKELSRPSTSKTLYLLDEPSTGLHFDDIKKMIKILERLVDKQNTVVVIEHNLDLIKIADWIIDLGPKGGKEGGFIMGEGTPEMLSEKSSLTGQFVKDALNDSLQFYTHQVVSDEKPITHIEVKNATQNHLKNIDITIERNEITAFTGPSGSGKSSLAIQTIFAEGQRRYYETLNAYARQFIEQSPKPKVESIQGLSASIVIEQKRHAGNPRSTVGTITEILDYLRILYAKEGIAVCPETKERLVHVTKEYIVNELLEKYPNEKCIVLAPIVPKKEESYKELFDRYQKEGFLRVRVQGIIYELADEYPTLSGLKESCELVIDRIQIHTSGKKRLLDAIETATQIDPRSILFELKDEAKSKKERPPLLHYYLAFSAPTTKKTYPKIEPKTFSFNADEGMCTTCEGIGSLSTVDIKEVPKLFKATLKDILDQVLHFAYNPIRSILKLLQDAGIDPKERLDKMSLPHLSFVLDGGKIPGSPLRWIGLHPFFERLFSFGKPQQKEALLPLCQNKPCPSCKGTRLNPLASNVHISSVTLPALLRMPIDEAFVFISQIQSEQDLSEVLDPIQEKLRFLIQIGVEYLSLDRTSLTLSGGEIQRIHLARQLGVNLSNCLYVLDEPSIGLHPHDHKKLLQALIQLKNEGNTLLLVEHDPMTLEIAKTIFEFGPEGGEKGGRILAKGKLEELKKDPHSITGKVLRKELFYHRQKKPIDSLTDWIQVENATKYSLKKVDVKIPKNRITALTGVSGSGKSTLMHEILAPILKKTTSSRKRFDSFTIDGCLISNIKEFKHLILVDQNPIGTTSRADICSYTELLGHFRSFYSELKEAQAYGLMPRHFSPNHIQGMCTECYGLGHIEVKLQLLPPAIKICPLCQGKRLSLIALKIKYQGLSLGDLFHMRAVDLVDIFSFHPKVSATLQLLIDVGMGHLRIGQEVQTLSHGESQRLRFVRELITPTKGPSLIFLDEPTTGLHDADILKLLPIFDRLIERGDTLLIIEHNITVLKEVDYLIEMGPKAGKEGGKIVAYGPYDVFVKKQKGITAPYLLDV